MTVVTVRWEFPFYRLQAEGHAEGSPEACAGVSAILYALAGWLENSGLTRECRLEPGDARIEAVAVRDLPVVEAAFEVAEIGLRQIAKKYPEQVRVKKE